MVGVLITAALLMVALCIADLHARDTVEALHKPLQGVHAIFVAKVGGLARLEVRHEFMYP